MTWKEKLFEKAGGVFGVKLYQYDAYSPIGGAWWESGDEDGIKRKAVYTDAFWLAPPYGRPRDIDYDRLEVIEKSVWVRMCVQHIVDAIAGAEWNMVPVVKGAEVPEENIKKPTEFFNGKGWDAPLSQVFRMLLPDAIQYDAGVLLKSYPVVAYDKETARLKSQKLPPVQLYARDGRSFMIDSGLFGNIKTYWQYSWINPQGKPIEFDPKEIIYFQKSPQSRNPYGIAVLEIIEEIIDYMIDSTLAQSKYWKNGLFVGGQIDLPEVRDLDELKRQQAYYEAKLRGPRKYNKWIVTGGGAVVKSMPFTPQQMQFIDSQKWFAKMVFGVFKLTPSELGFTEDLNRATGIQQMEIWKSNGVRPWLKLIEDMLNRHVVWVDFTDDVKFEFRKDMDLADKKIQSEIDSVRLDKGLDSVNELRLRDGLDTWEDEKYDLPSGTEAEAEEPETATDEEMDWESLFGRSASSSGFIKGGPGSGIKGHKTTQYELPTGIQSALTGYEYMEDMSEHQLEKYRKEILGFVKTAKEEYTKITEGMEATIASWDEFDGATDKLILRMEKHKEIAKGLSKIEDQLEGAFSEGEKKVAIDTAFNFAHTQGSFALFRGSELLHFHEEKIQERLDYVREQRIHKAARVSALSGEPGYVPMPEAYDGVGKPIKTKKHEDKTMEEVMEWLAELKDKAQNEIDRLYGEA